MAITIRVEVVDGAGLTSSMEREGDLQRAMLRTLTIRDFLRFLEMKLASLSMRNSSEYDTDERPKDLHDCVVEAVKEFLNKKGYRVRSVKRSTDNAIFVLSYQKVGY